MALPALDFDAITRTRAAPEREGWARKENSMDTLVPLLLLILGLGAAHLGVGGLLRAGKGGQQFWLFGLGVRTKFGAVKVLIVAASLCLLAYAIYRQGTLTRILEPPRKPLDDSAALQARQLEDTNRQIDALKAQLDEISREKERCQEIVSKQGSGLASKNDLAAELRASLSLRQREVATLQSTLLKAQSDLAALSNEHERSVQSAGQNTERIGQLESQLDVLRNEKVSLSAKLDNAAKANETELERLKDENAKLKALYKGEDRRAGLLRQGLVLREANDWALEQEIQRLANLISDQPDVSSPRQTDISRSLQRINQVLREGQSLTKQAKIADNRTPDAGQDGTAKVPERKK
jgi:hypothetical protein